MKKIITPIILLTLVGCSPIPVKATLPELNDLLVSYNVEGYTKKTYFFLTDAEREIEDNFHAKANSRDRATYYNEEESALLMGDYSGSFTTINSGYKNIIDAESGVQHFRFSGETATKDNIFTEIEEDWINEDQSIGIYYQTLTSLSNLIDKDKWSLKDGVYTYTISDLELNDGEYDDQVLKNFQYFAAPMLLQTLRYKWSSIKVKEGVEDAKQYLSIKLYSEHNSLNPVSGLVEGDEDVISEAKVFKGIAL